MKDNEVSKTILDLEVDNVRQSRELYKHIALLSSAIIGIFAFNKDQSIGMLSKIGISGLFIVIAISVILLFFALAKDKERLKITRDLSNNVKEIKEQFTKIMISGLITKDNIKSFIEFLKEAFTYNKNDSNESTDKKIDDFIAKASIFINASDDKIEIHKENAKTATKKSTQHDQAFNIIAIIGIFIFIISIGLILIDILIKV
jgi:ribosomal protein L21